MGRLSSGITEHSNLQGAKPRKYFQVMAKLLLQRPALEVQPIKKAINSVWNITFNQIE